MIWFNTLVVLALAALCEFAVPAVLVLLVVWLVAAVVRLWWQRRAMYRAKRQAVADAVAAAWRQAAEDEARQALLDRCATVRLNNVTLIPAPRRGEP